DYVRRLGGELITQGHQVGLVAINDRNITNITKALQTEGENKITALQIPSHLTWPQKTTYAKQFIDEFSPEWLSIQLTLFSYHYKGLPTRLAISLQYLGSGYKWHI